jgi:hypothetical protein
VHQLSEILMVEHYLVESISSSATFLDEESFDHLPLDLFSSRPHEISRDMDHQSQPHKIAGTCCIGTLGDSGSSKGI